MALVADCKAVFAKMTVTLRGTQMVFSLSTESVGLLPELSRLTGQGVFLSIEPAQTEMFDVNAYTEED